MGLNRDEPLVILIAGNMLNSVESNESAAAFSSFLSVGKSSLAYELN